MTSPIDTQYISEATISIGPDGEIAIIETDEVSLDYLRERLADVDSEAAVPNHRLYVEAVSLGDELTAWVDEEGLVKNLRPNRIGSGLVQVMAGGEAEASVRGPVVLTGGIDAEGKTTPLSQAQVERIVNLVQEIHASTR